MEHLPTPNAKEVTEFQKLYLQEFGVPLTDEEASDAATRVLQLFVLTSPKLYEHFEELKTEPKLATPNEQVKSDTQTRQKPPKRNVDGIGRRI